MMKKWWVIGVGLVLSTAGCKFVESVAERTEETSTASATTPGEAPPPEVTTPAEAGPEAPPETESPTAPTVSPEEKTAPPGSATEEEPTPEKPVEEKPTAAEPATTDGEKPSPASPETSEKAEPATTEAGGPTTTEKVESKPEKESEKVAATETETGKTALPEAEIPEEVVAEALPETEAKPKATDEKTEEISTAAAEEEAEEGEEVPGGGVKSKAKKTEAPRPAATETTPEEEAKSEPEEEPAKEAKPEKEVKPREEAELTGPEETEAPEKEKEEAKEERTAERQRWEARREAWEKAETARETRRQATFAAVKRHLSQVEDALDGKRNDLPEALSSLQRMRRSLSFLRSELTPVATWHHLDCALALLENDEVEAAKQPLEMAIRLAPVTAIAEEKEELSSDDEEFEEFAEEETEADEATPDEDESADEDKAARGRETDLRARLVALRKALDEDTVDDTRKELEKLLSGIPASEAEALMEALESEIDYASAALARASRKAAEVELESIRANVEELAKLVLGESEAGVTEGEQEEAGTAPEEQPAREEKAGLEKQLEEEGEGTPGPEGTSASGSSSELERTSRLPVAAAFLGTLAVAVLLRSRMRRRE